MAREFEDPHCVVLSMSPWTDHITSVGCKCPCYQVGEAVEHSLEEPTLWNWVAHVHIPANLMLLPQLLTILFDPFTKLMCASLTSSENGDNNIHKMYVWRIKWVNT